MLPSKRVASTATTQGEPSKKAKPASASASGTIPPTTPSSAASEPRATTESRPTARGPSSVHAPLPSTLTKPIISKLELWWNAISAVLLNRTGALLTPISLDEPASDVMRRLAPMYGLLIDDGDAMRYSLMNSEVKDLRATTLREVQMSAFSAPSHGLRPSRDWFTAGPRMPPTATYAEAASVADTGPSATPTQPHSAPVSTATGRASASRPVAAPATAPSTPPAPSMATRHPKPIPKKSLSAKPGQIVTEELWLEDLSETKSKRIYCGFRRGRDDGEVAVIAGWDESVESVVRHLARLYGFTIADGPDALSYSMMGTVLRNPTLEDVIQEDDINNPRRTKGVDLMYRLKVNIKRG